VGENSLRVVPVEELPKRHRVVVHVEEPDLSAEEALRLLGRQNTGLATGDWIVTRGSVSRDAMTTCLVGDQSLDALKSCNFRPHCSFGRTFVRLLERECGGKPESMEETPKGTA